MYANLGCSGQGYVHLDVLDGCIESLSVSDDKTGYIMTVELALHADLLSGPLPSRTA